MLNKWLRAPTPLLTEPYFSACSNPRTLPLPHTHSAQIPPLGAIKIHKKASQEKVAESFPIDDLPERPRQRGASAGASRGRGWGTAAM